LIKLRFKKNRNFPIFFQNYDIFKATGKSKKFKPKKLHHFVDLDKLILKMYTVWGFDIAFHKIFEENWKKLSRNKLFH